MATTQKPDLSKARYYFTLAAKERRRADHMKFHDKGMDAMFAALGWPRQPGPQEVFTWPVSTRRG